jgi:histidinol dehydrogenase
MRILSRRADIERFLAGRRLALAEAEAVARPILAEVRKRGDGAVAKYSARFDGYRGPLRLESADLERCWLEQPAALRRAMEVARRNIARFARLQMPRQWRRRVAPGVQAGQIVRPLESVGCYAPGGRFPLFSTVLMTAVPALVAGVNNVYVASPRPAPALRAAAHAARATALFAVGGVQAIAALAYGTETIPRVDKIVGPGNIYVSAAKKLLAGEVAIDFIAGPTEIVIVAQEGDPEFLAADLLAQAEHDPRAAAILVTPSRALAQRVAARVPPGWKNCVAMVTGDLEQALELSNRIAPEHLSLANPSWLAQVRNAGSVFLGPFSPEAAGDYASGPNHVLPTAGAARLRGGLSVMDFVKIISVQQLSREGLARLAPAVATLARAEGLEHHARSVELRLGKNRGSPQRHREPQRHTENTL